MLIANINGLTSRLRRCARSTLLRWETISVIQVTIWQIIIWILLVKLWIRNVRGIILYRWHLSGNSKARWKQICPEILGYHPPRPGKTIFHTSMIGRYRWLFRRCNLVGLMSQRKIIKTVTKVQINCWSTQMIMLEGVIRSLSLRVPYCFTITTK